MSGARAGERLRYTKRETTTSTMVAELYDALRKAGVDEQLAPRMLHVRYWRLTPGPTSLRKPTSQN
jgi:hypothetical protein